MKALASSLLMAVVVAALTLAVSFAAPLQSHGGDTTAGRLGAVALACERSFDLRTIDAFARADARRRLPYYLVRSRTGALVSSFGPTPSIVAWPGMRSLRPGMIVGERALLRRARYGSAAAVALAAVLLALALSAERSARVSLGFSLAAALSFAGAATLAQAPWQQTVGLLWLTGSLACVAWSRRSPWLAAPALACAVSGAWSRPPAVMLFAALAVAAMRALERDRRRWFAAVVLTTLTAAPLIAWNVTHHGTLIGGGQAATNVVIAGDVGVWTIAPWTIAYRLVALALSPARGLLWYAPLALVALAVALRDDDRTRRIVAVGALAHVLLTAAFFRWHGGQCVGPRLLSEVVWVAPWLVLHAAKGWRTAAVGAAVLTVFVGAVAAVRHDPRRWELQHDLDARPAEAWSLIDSPIVAWWAREPVGAPVGDGPAGPFRYCAPHALATEPVARVMHGP